MKYARACRFEVRLNFNKNELRLELQDDGEGFSMTDRHDGFGLIGMRERVEQMGGTLRVTRVCSQLDYLRAMPAKHSTTKPPNMPSSLS